MKFWFSTIVSILKIRKQKYNKWVEVTEIRERNIVKYIPSARECRLCYVASSVLGHLFQTHIQDLHFSNFSLLSSAAPVRVPVMLKNLLKYIKMDCEGPEVCILTNFWVDFLNLALKNCSKVTRLNKSLPFMKTITYISLYITLRFLISYIFNSINFHSDLLHSHSLTGFSLSSLRKWSFQVGILLQFLHCITSLTITPLN